MVKLKFLFNFTAKSTLQNVANYFVDKLLPVLKKDLHRLEKILKSVQGGSVSKF